ncbi:MAG TPA: AAA family ATPase [Nitrososphaerales archaeon]
MKGTSVIAITGTPATGKKTIGKLVAKKLGYEFLEINTVAKKLGADIGRKGGEMEVETSIIYKKLPRLLEGKKTILVGHLLPHCIPDSSIDYAAVLRCSPQELVKRYTERGYSRNKVKANVVVEAIDLCLSETLIAFKKSKIAEIDTTGRDAKKVAEEVIEKFKNPKKRSFGGINWLHLMAEDSKMRKYLK